jgi:RNA recognition motif-containing protein
MAHQGYGFCEFLTEEDAEYACKIMNQIKLWGKPIRVNKVPFRANYTTLKCFRAILLGFVGQETARCRRQPLHR